MNVNQYDLFIFDLDDTLVKTEHLHYQAWNTILKSNIDFLTFCSKFHSAEKDAIKNYLTNELYLEDYDQRIKDKNEYYMTLLNQESANIHMVAGAQKYLEEIIRCGKKFVIVSNSLKSNIDFFCDFFPILKQSTKNYYREMFTNKKPDPECYQRVIADFPAELRKIGFEDSITGIHAMMQVPSIKTVFINSPSYYYYDYIIENYTVDHIINYTKNLER